jgi:hypothetical protein
VNSEKNISSILNSIESLKKESLFKRAGTALSKSFKYIKNGLLSVNDFAPESNVGRFLGGITGVANKALLPLGIAAGGFDIYNQYRQGQSQGDNDIPTLVYDALLGQRSKVSGKGAYTGAKNAVGNILGVGGRGSAIGAIPGLILGAGALIGAPFTGGTSLSLLPAAGTLTASGAGTGFIAGAAVGATREGINALAKDESTGDKVKSLLQELFDPATSYFISIANRLKEVDTEIANIDLKNTEGSSLSEEEQKRRDSLVREKKLLKNISDSYGDFSTGSGDRNRFMDNLIYNQQELNGLVPTEYKAGASLLSEVEKAFESNRKETASISTPVNFNYNEMIDNFYKNLTSLAQSKSKKGSSFSAFTNSDIQDAVNNATESSFHYYSDKTNKQAIIDEFSNRVFGNIDKFTSNATFRGALSNSERGLASRLLNVGTPDSIRKLLSKEFVQPRIENQTDSSGLTSNDNFIDGLTNLDKFFGYFSEQNNNGDTNLSSLNKPEVLSPYEQLKKDAKTSTNFPGMNSFSRSHNISNNTEAVQNYLNSAYNRNSESILNNIPTVFSDYFSKFGNTRTENSLSGFFGKDLASSPGLISNGIVRASPNVQKLGILAAFAPSLGRSFDDYSNNIELTKSLGLKSVYEKEGILFTEKHEQQLFSWFARCWKKAGGEHSTVPTYFAFDKEYRCRNLSTGEVLTEQETAAELGYNTVTRELP